MTGRRCSSRLTYPQGTTEKARACVRALSVVLTREVFSFVGLNASHRRVYRSTFFSPIDNVFVCVSKVDLGRSPYAKRAVELQLASAW